MIVDASVLLAALFDDDRQLEAQDLLQQHTQAIIQFKAPMILHYELENVTWQAERRERITTIQADQIMQTLDGLGIQFFAPLWGKALNMARRSGCSVYDAAYLVLAESLGEVFVTNDRRLYEAVKDVLPWVELLGKV
jgi:predicted nucleic acid-binding protein